VSLEKDERLEEGWSVDLLIPERWALALAVGLAVRIEVDPAE